MFETVLEKTIKILKRSEIKPPLGLFRIYVTLILCNNSLRDEMNSFIL